MVNIPSWPPVPLWKKVGKLDLDNMLLLLEKLGNPHNLLPPTVHIAGTNGKGSSVAMLKSIYEQAGYRVHTYTSPHLVEFNERISLAGNAISDDQLNYFLTHTKYAADKIDLQPTFFEGVTAAAFLAFSSTPADILLLETGLGGRLDCTNVISAPLATIITPISYDHMEFLGEDIRQIASEKAGIIKNNVPCVIGPQVPQVQELLLAVCRQKNSPSFCYEYDYIAEKTDKGFKYLSQKYTIELPRPRLLGDHQIANAATTIAALMLINEHFKVTNDQIAQGLSCVEWPGRIQLIEKEKVYQLTGRNDIKIYLDGAHNDAGAQVLALWAAENLKEPIYMILGMTRKRNATSFCSHFKNIVTKGVAVKVESEPSAYNAVILAENASKSGISFSYADSLKQAIDDIAMRVASPATIIITGSLFLVADFLKN